MKTRDKPTFMVPLAVAVPLLAGEITVRSADVGTLLRVKEQLLPTLSELLAKVPGLLSGGAAQRLKAGGDLSAQDIAEMLLVLEQADEVVDFMATLSGLQRADVLALMPDAFAYLFAVVLQVNWDFFDLALPVFKAAVQRVRAAQGDVAPQATAAAPQTTLSPAPSTA